ncbi:bifunctional glycosyltransferase 87/phosphatase PAP2 family protein [Streptomyces sp. NPDC050504]|uniref:bifunctional glycosyltransferase 87/phosphatase PAP2 family protein n=1 Tax=Streptomyces sp. NPDC050504 TaxID=3365618 RepID=UPI0037AD5F61
MNGLEGRRGVANAEHSVRSGTTAGNSAGNRQGALRAALWFFAAVLAVRQMAVVLRKPEGERWLDLGAWTGEGGVLRTSGSLYDADKFTGTPFAGLVLKPLSHAAEQALGVAWTFGTLLLVVALGLVVARSLPEPVTRRARLFAPPVAIILLLLSLPVRNAVHLGQTSIVPVLLVVLACLAVRGERTAGVLVGIAAALQPAVLLFAPLLWFTGRRRAAAGSVATFAAGTALAWAALPDDSRTYWIHHVAGAGLGGDADSPTNQSLHGMLLRFGLSGPLEVVLLLVLAAAVAFVGLRRAVHFAEDGQLLLAVALTGCVAVAVSPTAWQHQLVWLLLAVVGRVGKRARDRLVWPVAVVLVMTLPGKWLLPNRSVLQPVQENVLLIAALAAALAVPFLSRNSPHFRRPIPTDYAKPVPGRWSWVPLVPFWRRVLSRPNLLLELLLIRVGYSLYSQIRMEATAGRADAEAHGRQIHELERWLHIDIEKSVNHAVVEIGWLRDFFDFYYTSFHFVVPLTILGVLYWRLPSSYRWVRSSLAFATLIALIGFFLYPLAPPRLMPGMGFIDTVHGVQDFSKPDYGSLTEVTNQYAAMPSLHFGWSLWCGVVIVMMAPKWWMKALGLLHPLFTVIAIVATANHWIMDAVGGAAVVAAGFGLTYVLAGPLRLQAKVVAQAVKADGSAGGSADGSADGSAGGRAAEAKDAMCDGSAVPAGSAGSGSGASKSVR